MIQDDLFAEFETESDPDEEYFEAQAWFCLATGVSPFDYDRMTPQQISKWIDVVKKRK